MAFGLGKNQLSIDNLQKKKPGKAS